MNACIAATSNSSMNINIANAIDTGMNPIPANLLNAAKINIMDITQRITMCPASILAKRRMVNATGLMNREMISMGTSRNLMPNGTPGGFNR